MLKTLNRKYFSKQYPALPFFSFLYKGIGRTLIPRYFRSIFEGGVTDLRYDLRHPKESFHNTTITLDCDQCTVVTLHGKPMFTKVCTNFTSSYLLRYEGKYYAHVQ